MKLVYGSDKWASPLPAAGVVARFAAGALNTVARVRAENGDAAAFRLMQAQAMSVGQRRIELSMHIDEMEGPAARP
jgi:hypothetical protein